MAGARRTRVVVGDKMLAVRIAVSNDGPKLGVLIGPGCCFVVQPVDREAVPAADTNLVGVAEIEVAVLDRNSRRRIVHDRGAIVVTAAGEIVLESERVAGLVHRQLPQAGERDAHRVVLRTAARFGGAGEPFEYEAVLAHPLRTKQHRAFDDFPGTRVNDVVAVRPAACLAMNPVDYVVACIERADALRQDLDSQRVDEAGGSECLRPPAGAFDQRAAHRFGRGAVDVKHDRLLDRRRRRARIRLFQTKAMCQPIDDRRIERHRVVADQGRDAAGARIGNPRLVAGRRQPDQRVVRDQRDGMWVRHDAANFWPGLIAAEGLVRFEFHVLRKHRARPHIGVRQVGVDVEIALFRGRQRIDDPD